MFKESAGEDLINQLKFASDQGFVAWEDNLMKERPVEIQEKIAAAMDRLGMEMGVISATRDVNNRVHFAGTDESARTAALDAVRQAIDVAHRVHAKWMTVVPGLADAKLLRDYQTANCVDLLRRCCDLVEPHGLVLVIEPLNPHTDHPGIFLQRVSQGYAICKSVARPSCRVLFDIYHEQISEGNLIPNINVAWDQVGYFQVADNPGRNEPGTGEINYRNIFRHLHHRGWTGIVGMEHGNSRPGKEGEQSLIRAYVETEAF